MSVWLTPDLEPFYGGTYFPPAARWGRPGFVDVLRETARVWGADRAKVRQSASALTAKLREAAGASEVPAMPGPPALERTVQQFRQAFDAQRGGFGESPKFPRPSELLFLLREYARTGNGDARAMALRTLRAMALGGMRDHVGGGFHRYSVDAEWRVPHFEKMLYDQAQLVIAFVEGAQASGDTLYLEVAEDTLLYVLREMTDPAGGFYSAEDADSLVPETAGGPEAHKSEGAFYLWRADEIDALFGADAGIVRGRFGIEPGGNAPADPQQEFTGKNLLYVARSIDDLATQAGKSADEVVETLSRARVAMFQHRLGRPRPDRDDKILTAWNGLMIAACARTARVVAAMAEEGDPAAAPYLDAARRAAGFIRARMWDPGTGRLLRCYRGGNASIDGYAEDYAYLVFGLLELFQADPDPSWLEWAIALQRRQDHLFWDEESAGWFSTSGRDPSVLLRLKDDYDGAEPTASSVSVSNLLTLSHLVDDPEWPARIERTLGAFGTRLEQLGRGVPMMAAALSTAVAGVQQVVVIAESGGPDADRSLERTLAYRYMPFAIQLRVSRAELARLADVLPFLAEMATVANQTTVYVCRDRACRPPATTVAALEGALAS
jgi:hypothetical protein